MPYNINSSSENNILNKLQKNMLTNELLEVILNNEFINKDNNKKYTEKVFENNNKINNKKVDNDWIILNKDDKKFWYFYMFLNDLELCDLPGNHERFKIETETKIKFIEELNNLDKSLLKIHKISKNKVQSSISDFKNKISLVDLITLCILYKKNLIYATNNMYYEICAGLTSGNNKFEVIVKDENNVEKIPNEIKKEEVINKIRNEYYKLDSISKIIKSISSYTLQELQDIAKKLNITTQTEEGKNKLKKILYDDISNKINSFK